MSLLHQLALNYIPSIGGQTVKTLLHTIGDEEAIFKANKKLLMTISGIGLKSVAAFFESKDKALALAEIEIKKMEQEQIHAVFITDENYPTRLKHCYDAPIILFTKGNLNLHNEKMLGIVGTRNATEQGKLIVDQLIASLVPYGITVLSGLAYGIDIAAHIACLKYRVPTIGVLAHGLEKVYPSEHRTIAGKMMEIGGLLSEYSIGSSLLPMNFPMRNRLIAGLTDATIVVEAGIKGGALITAELANNYNRDVFAFPGRITDPYAQGCHYLIKSNKAQLVSEAKDIVESMNWEEKTLKKLTIQRTLFLELNAEEQAIFDLLLEKEYAIDAICSQLQLPQSKISLHLLQMELKGIVQSLPGKRYQLV